MKAAPPSKILEEVGPKEISERCKAYHRIYYHLRERWPYVRLEGHVLRNAVESYYVDLLRIKPFHEIGLADQHKRAAYTLKWITRLRPLFWLPPEDEKIKPTKAILMANEVYGIYLALTHLRIHPTDVPDPFFRNLLYSLHYHSPSADEMATMLYLLEELVRHKSITNMFKKRFMGLLKRYKRT